MWIASTQGAQRAPSMLCAASPVCYAERAPCVWYCRLVGVGVGVGVAVTYIRVCPKRDPRSAAQSFARNSSYVQAEHTGYVMRNALCALFLWYCPCGLRWKKKKKNTSFSCVISFSNFFNSTSLSSLHYKSYTTISNTTATPPPSTPSTPTPTTHQPTPN